MSVEGEANDRDRPSDPSMRAGSPEFVRWPRQVNQVMEMRVVRHHLLTLASCDSAHGSPTARPSEQVPIPRQNTAMARHESGVLKAVGHPRSAPLADVGAGVDGRHAELVELQQARTWPASIVLAALRRSGRAAGALCSSHSSRSSPCAIPLMGSCAEVWSVTQPVRTPRRHSRAARRRRCPEAPTDTVSCPRRPWR